MEAVTELREYIGSVNNNFKIFSNPIMIPRSIENIKKLTEKEKEFLSDILKLADEVVQKLDNEGEPVFDLICKIGELAWLIKGDEFTKISIYRGNNIDELIEINKSMVDKSSAILTSLLALIDN